MPDRFSAAVRSKIMSRITKKWSQIDRKTHNILKSAKVRHSMYPKLLGSPDVLVYPDVLLFLDGCFWHRCPKCFRQPKSRLEYWRPKLIGNEKRDVRNSSLLRRQGWRVIRIWEHEIRERPNGILRRLEGLRPGKPELRAPSRPRHSTGGARSVPRR
jgi:DNA mismatch endonuclease (patch repair protein)